MIAWIVGIVTLILLVLIFWRRTSKAFRERAEEPKYLFLENLGITIPRGSPDAPSKSSQEENDESTHS
jgi:hypothetical protein